MRKNLRYLPGQYFLRCFILISTLFITLISFSQVTNEWNRIVDYDDGAARAVAIAKDGAGNVYIATHSNSNDQATILSIKYSPNGTQLWSNAYYIPFSPDENLEFYATGIAVNESGSRVYIIGYKSTNPSFIFPEESIILKFRPDVSGDVGSLGNTVIGFEPSDIELDADGNVYITGTRWLNTPSFHEEYFTRKLNPELGIIWSGLFTLSTAHFSQANALALDASGNAYVTGKSGTSTGDKIATIKYNGVNGGIMNVAQYAGSANFRDEGLDIAVDVLNNVYVTGGSWEGTPGLFPTYNQFYTTIKYNSNLSQQWVNTYDGALGGDDDIGRALVVDAAGNINVTGISGDHLETDIVTIKYNSAGSQQWLSIYGGPAESNDIGTDGIGNLYVTGWGIGYGRDIITFKYNSGGVEQWRTVYSNVNEPSDDNAVAMVIDANANIYVTGATNYDPITIKYIQCNVSCPENVSVNNTPGQCGAIVTYPGATAPPICGTLSYSHASGSFFPVGTTTVNVSSETIESICTFTITVVDNQIPVITACPSNVTVSCAANVPVVNTSSVTATDNCPVTITHVGDVITNQTCANRYTITRTYKAADPSGNMVTCQQVITVSDNLDPVITCPANITVSCAANVPAVNISSVTATDNCAGVVVTHVSDIISNQTCANRFTLTRTYKATDACGNMVTCQQVVTVFDNTPPVITGLTATPEILWPPNHKMRDVTVSYGINDNCTTPNTTISVSSNEPINGTGDGDTAPDWLIIDNHHVKLRAERAGNGNGRIYTITITTDDGCNAPVSATTQLFVPLDNSVTIRNEIIQEELSAADKLQLVAYPNPTAKHFNIRVRTPDNKEKITMQVFDQVGRLIETRNHVLAGSLIQLGDMYKPGTYYVRIIQGKAHGELKLVKFSE